jgi:hypothetical protein
MGPIENYCTPEIDAHHFDTPLSGTAFDTEGASLPSTDLRCQV